jgi:hypothetical protein
MKNCQMIPPILGFVLVFMAAATAAAHQQYLLLEFGPEHLLGVW